MPYQNIITGQTSNTNPGGSNAGWVPVSGGGGGSSGGGSSGGGSGGGGIWSGVNWGQNLINPGSVWQSYNPNTGQTTYGSPPPGFMGSVVGSGPAVATPTNTPAGAPVYQGGQYGYLPSSPSTNFGNKTVNGIPIISSDFAIDPTKKYSDITSEPTNSGLNIKNATENAVKANEIVSNAEKKNQLASQINATISDPNQYNKTVNANFIQALAQSKYGRAATADELKGVGTNPYGLMGMTVGQAAARFGYSPTMPGIPDGTGNIPEIDPALVDLNTGLIDMMKFQETFMRDFNNIVNEVAQAQTDLINYQAGTQEGTQNIGQQTGTEQGLLQGEALAFQQQRSLKENTLAQLLNVKESKKANLLQSGQLQLQFLKAASDLREQIYQRSRDLRNDQKEAFASMLELAKVGGLDLTKISPDQTLRLSSMAKAIGIDPNLLINGLKAVQAQGLLSGQETSIITIGNTQYLLTYKNGQVVSKVPLGPKPSSGGGSSPKLTGLEADMDQVANMIISAERAGSSSSESYWNQVNAMSEASGLAVKDIDRMLINTINSKKGQPLTYSPQSSVETTTPTTTTPTTTPQNFKSSNFRSLRSTVKTYQDAAVKASWASGGYIQGLYNWLFGK